MTKEESKQVKAGCLFALVWMWLGPIVSGFVLCSLWAWFIVPLGARNGVHIASLTIPLAIGVSMITAFLTSQYDGKEGKSKPMTELIGMTVARPIVAYAFGYIVHLWVSK